MNFGERIKQQRLDKGLSAYRLAKSSGISNSNICNLEKGRYSSLTDNLLQKLASVEKLGVTFEQLRAWRLLDEYNNEEISIAIKEGA